MGFNTTYLLSATGSGEQIVVDVAKPINLVEASLNSRREPIQFMGVIGTGFYYNIPHSMLVVDLRYNMGFTEQVNPASRTNAQDEMAWMLYGKENDFRINNFMVSLSFLYKFYKPKKK